MLLVNTNCLCIVQVTAYCEWLTPPHVAVLPLRVYRPLTLIVSEHCGGQRSFLRVDMVNSCPLPLALRNVALSSTPFTLTPLHTQPQVRDVSECEM